MLLPDIDYNEILRESFPFFLIFNHETEEIETNKNTQKLFQGARNTNISTLPSFFKTLIRNILDSNDGSTEAEIKVDEKTQTAVNPQDGIINITLNEKDTKL